MNKKLLVSVFLCFFVFLFVLLSQEESKEKKIWEDERIGITLDKLEWGYSSESKDVLPNYKLKEGFNLFSSYLTIEKIKDMNLLINLPRTSYKQSQSLHLVDEQGLAHNVINFKFEITTDSLAEAMNPKLREGMKGCIFFEVPKGTSPAQLKFIYPYTGELPKPKRTKYGCVTIDLFKVRVMVEEAIIRLRPQAESEVIAKVSLGTVFAPERKVGEWYQISFRDERGFVLSGYIHESDVTSWWE